MLSLEDVGLSLCSQHLVPRNVAMINVKPTLLPFLLVLIAYASLKTASTAVVLWYGPFVAVRSLCGHLVSLLVFDHSRYTMRCDNLRLTYWQGPYSDSHPDRHYP